MTVFDIDEIVAWLDLAGRVSGVAATGLIARLRDGDENVTHAIQAILAVDESPSARLTTLRDFVITQAVGDPYGASVSPLAQSALVPISPLEVPEHFLETWFGDLSRPVEDSRRRYEDGLTVAHTLRIRQFYDCIHLDRQKTLSSTKLFDNVNIGTMALTNLQVSGQLASDTPALLTSWWITTIPWVGSEEFFAQSWARMSISDRDENVINGLELVRHRQAILTPVPVRHHINVRFDFTSAENLPSKAVPLYIFLEGWIRRS